MKQSFKRFSFEIWKIRLVFLKQTKKKEENLKLINIEGIIAILSSYPLFKASNFQTGLTEWQ